MVTDLVSFLLSRICDRCIGLTKGGKTLDLRVVIVVHHLASMTSMYPNDGHAENDTIYGIIVKSIYYQTISD